MSYILLYYVLIKQCFNVMLVELIFVIWLSHYTDASSLSFRYCNGGFCSVDTNRHKHTQRERLCDFSSLEASSAVHIQYVYQGNLLSEEREGALQNVSLESRERGTSK